VKQDCEGIRLFAGRAARHPDAHVLIRRNFVQNPRDDRARNSVERLRITEEARDADEHVLVQAGELARVVAELRDVFLDALEPAHRDASLDAAAYRRGLVVGEVDPALVPEHAKNGFFARLHGSRIVAEVSPAGAR
jgi:hypothetical protein